MSFASFALLAVNCVFIENLVLVQFLGIRPFLLASHKRNTALLMGMSVTLIMTISTLITWLIRHFVLLPLKLEYMQTVAFVLVIAALVQVIEILLMRVFPVLYQTLGIYLPLTTANCAILGIILSIVRDGYGLLDALGCSLFSAVGFTFVIWMFACIRERIEYCDVPKAFQGIPIALVTAALLSLAFMGFGGMSF